MKHEHRNPNAGCCEAMQHELLEAACDGGDVQSLSNATRVHLVRCAACRDELLAQRELLAELQSVLQPEPLPSGLSERIWQRIESAAHSGGASKMRRPTVRWGAVAAAVVLAVAPAAAWWFARVHLGGRAPTLIAKTTDAQPAPAIADGIATSDAAAKFALSDDESAAVVEALTYVAWDAPVDEGVSKIPLTSASIASKSTSTQSQASGTVLPWTSDDDWDRPLAAERGAPRGSSGRSSSAS